jgi:seryl-tRNA synthetase
VKPIHLYSMLSNRSSANHLKEPARKPFPSPNVMTSRKLTCRIENLERQLSETRQTAKSKQSAAVAAELEVKNLQAWLARAEDELERVKSELRAKVKTCRDLRRCSVRIWQSQSGALYPGI